MSAGMTWGAYLCKGVTLPEAPEKEGEYMHAKCLCGAVQMRLKGQPGGYD